MRILKIKGKDETVIKEQIEKEYGEKAIIITTHCERGTGIKGWFTKPTIIVTIALDEEDDVKPNTHEKLPTPEDPLEKVINEIKLFQQEIPKGKVKEDSSKTKDDSNATYPEIKQILSKSLINEGIEQQVIDALLEDVDDQMDLEDVARSIYIKLAEVLKVNEKITLPKVVFFVGSTGVGKTTTIAKLTAELVLNQRKDVALITADTYRIAAIEQLKTYAEIINVPVEVVYSERDFEENIKKWESKQHIFVDTAGRSHKNILQVEEIEKFLNQADDKKIFLVINISTNYRDAQKIIDLYKTVLGDFSLIFTKLDETDDMGNLINIAYYAQMPIAYITTGQDVPDDIEKFNKDDYIKQLLGRISYE